MEYLLRGYDEEGHVIVESPFDAVDDEDAAERAQAELASGGFDHCFQFQLYRLSYVASL
jgi:hypothetical protein